MAAGMKKADQSVWSASLLFGFPCIESVVPERKTQQGNARPGMQAFMASKMRQTPQNQ
jgi:hypothetical protein